jgi:hypothetical protein
MSSGGFEFSRKGSEYGSANLKQSAGFFLSDKCAPANRKKGFHTSRFPTPFQEAGTVPSVFKYSLNQLANFAWRKSATFDNDLTQRI